MKIDAIVFSERKKKLFNVFLISSSLQASSSNRVYHYPKNPYGYQKHMLRVDDEHRPVLEGLCPDKIYVSTDDIRICDNRRLPPLIHCKMTQGFFRPIPPPQFHHNKTTQNGSFL